MFLLGGGENRRTSLCKLSYLPLPLHELLFFDYKEPNIHGNHFKIQLQILGLGLVLPSFTSCFATHGFIIAIPWLDWVEYN